MQEKKRLLILVAIISISGFSQGMIMPLISVIFERDGLSASLTGLNATALYLGTLLITPFSEVPLRRYGYKPIILIGGALVFTSLLAFPLWKSLTFWFVLRLLIGVGDSMLHYSTQTWITSFSPAHRLGRNIALYGLSFGVGFAAGPLFVPLVNVFEGLPFIVSSVLCLTAWSLVFLVRNERPVQAQGKAREENAFERYRETLKFAWVAFIPSFSYGFLESSLYTIFPVYALRLAFDVSTVAIILTALSTGGIISLYPLGALGDRIGRKKVLIIALLGGAVSFGVASFFEHSSILLAVLFFFAGAFIGSTYSLSISYMADLTPKVYVPTGNLLTGMFFSIGSLSGPFLGGVFLEYVQEFSFLTLVALLLFVLGAISFISPKRKKSS